MPTPLPANRLFGGGALAAIAGLALTALVGPPAHAAEEVYNPDTDNSAYAWHLNPANEVDGGDYTITLDPASRTGAPDGNPSLTWGPGVITVDTGCPAGYRSSSRSFIVTEAGVETEIVVPRQGVSTGWGLDGGSIRLASNRDVGDWTALNSTTLPTGTNALVITCDPTAVEGIDYAIPSGFTVANAKYFVAYLAVDRATESWRVTEKPGGTVKTDTTVAAASSAVSATSATLSATVTPAEATGKVVFTSGSISQEATVSNGTASISVSGLTPATEYTFTASYGGDDAHNGSTGTVALTTAAASDSSNSDVTVTVPEAAATSPTGLKISVKPSPVSLTGAATRDEGAVWTATGSTGDITVNDDRRSATTGWTLNGRVSAFASGENTIAASNLGWAPVKVGGAGRAGTVVGPGSGTGLAADAPLASGDGSASSNVTTTVKADLTLSVPAAAPAGAYTGTLTLTLI